MPPGCPRKTPGFFPESFVGGRLFLSDPTALLRTPPLPEPLSMQDPSAAIRRAQQRYWQKNLTVMILLLGLWAFVGLGCGILWADWLNQWNLGGVPLGFWFAQQGSIATFVVIILVYAITMNRLDANYHQQVRDASPGSPPPHPASGISGSSAAIPGSTDGSNAALGAGHSTSGIANPTAPPPGEPGQPQSDSSIFDQDQKGGDA